MHSICIFGIPNAIPGRRTNSAICKEKGTIFFFFWILYDKLWSLEGRDENDWDGRREGQRGQACRAAQARPARAQFSTWCLLVRHDCTSVYPMIRQRQHYRTYPNTTAVSSSNMETQHDESIFDCCSCISGRAFLEPQDEQVCTFDTVDSCDLEDQQLIVEVVDRSKERKHEPPAENEAQDWAHCSRQDKFSIAILLLLYTLQVFCK